MTITLNNERVEGAPIDAATVILLRDGNDGLETLLLCRANSRTVMNKAWVFPGGKLDDSDYQRQSAVAQAKARLNESDISVEKADALFAAACRETHEETGVQLHSNALVPWSRWITPNEPSMMKKRFDARFFVAIIPEGQTAVHDGSEATDSAWYMPKDALRAYQQHAIALAPPQIMTMLALCAHVNVAACINCARNTPTYCIQPGVLKGEGGSRTLVYPGDPQHPEPHQEMPGPTRLVWKKDHFEPEDGFTRWM